MAETAPLGECGAPQGGRALWTRTRDGVRLRLAIWPGERQVLILPGRTEYIEKYGLVVRDLAAAGWGAVLVDWRGQGLSDRALRDPLRGHIADFAEYQHDLDAVLAALPAPMPWLAHSMGGCIALRGLMRDQRPPAVALSAPMLALAQPAGQVRALRLLAGLARPLRADRGYAPTTGPRYGLPSMPFEGNPLTHDRAQFDRMKAQIDGDDRLTIAGPTLRWMGAALAEMAALAAQPSPPVPALLGLGHRDPIVGNAAIRERAARWPEAELVEYPEARHELTMERPAVRDDFLRRALALFDRPAG